MIAPRFEKFLYVIPVLVVTLFTAGEVETEASVITSTVSTNVLNVVRGKLKVQTKHDNLLNLSKI